MIIIIKEPLRRGVCQINTTSKRVQKYYFLLYHVSKVPYAHYVK